jgi:hypothetical protein
MNLLRFWTKCSVLLVASVLFVAFALSSSAQVQSTTSTTSGSRGMYLC